MKITYEARTNVYKVWQLARLLLSSSYPYQTLFAQAFKALGSG